MLTTPQFFRRAAAGIALAILPATLTACQPKQTAKLSAEQVADYNKSAIVLIQTNHKVDFSYPEPTINQRKFDQLTQDASDRFTRGELKTQSEVMSFMFKEFFGNPTKYLRAGNKVQTQADVDTTGTGFVIDGSGLVATASHVVSNEGDSIKQAIAETALEKVTVGFCKASLSSLSTEAQTVLAETTSAKELMTQCIQGFAGYYSEYLTIGKVQTKASVVMQSTMPGQNGTPKVFTSEIKKFGKTIPDEDVAILKISGVSNLPTIKLGDSKTAVVGNHVISIGFPGAITKNFSESKTLSEPTLTSGSVSAIQKGMLQTEAVVSPGSSGGPLFNEKGEVIGVASFIALNDKGAAVGGGNFFVPTSVLQQFLQENGLTAKPSEINQRYQQAAELYQAGHYRRSLKMFEEIRNTNPDYPYIQQKISEAQNNIPNEPTDWGMILGGAALALGVLGGAGGFIAKRYLSHQKRAANPEMVPITMPQPTANQDAPNYTVLKTGSIDYQEIARRN
jgi:serine protease Do